MDALKYMGGCRGTLIPSTTIMLPVNDRTDSFVSVDLALALIYTIGDVEEQVFHLVQ
jgi:hypothetical protein